MGNRNHIFLLEDNFEVGDSLRRMLEMRDFTVTWAKSIADAFTKWDTCPGDVFFDFIICDYELPDGFGTEFLLGVDPDPEIVVIFSSGLDRTKELAAAGVTVDHQITKGAYSTEQLLEILR